MAATVIIPTTLRGFAEGHPELSLDGSTVREVLSVLSDEYPEMGSAIFDEAGNLRTFVNVFVGDSHIDELDGMDTAVGERDEIILIPAIAGGGGADESANGDVSAAPSANGNASSALSASGNASLALSSSGGKSARGAQYESVLDAETPLEALTNDEISRYSRHLLLKEIGVKGQKKLKAARVLIIGMGGLGAPLAQYLAAAGVGTIGLCDFDAVDASNLQRQIIYRTRDVKRPKVMAAKDFIKGLNPLVKTETYDYPVNADNISELIADYDVIADATDNFKTRYLINDACVLAGKPVVFGAMYQFEGQASVFWGKKGPCYRCMYPAPPPPELVPSCSTGGVMGVLPGIIGTIQAGEVIKLIVGDSQPLIGRMLMVDEWRLKFRELRVRKNSDCPICGERPTITTVVDFDYEDFCGLKEAAKEEAAIEGIEARELARRMEEEPDKIKIVDVREPHERAIVKFPQAVIIPIGQLARRKGEFDPTIDTVFICKEGKRSQLAIKTLREAGYDGPMYNLKDGLETWAREVDPSMPIY